MEENKSVLHELYVFSEWKPEPEYLQKPENIWPESISAFWHWVKFFGPKKSLIDSITLHKNKQQKWHIALGDEGKVIAILTDNILEIRTKRSEYATIAARTTVTRDAYPQWRKVVWSPDCSFIAVAYGNGVVSFFDLTASNLFTIPTDCSRPGGMECTDNTHAVAEIIFTPLRVKDNKWSWEVIIVTYDGHLRNYLVSQTAGYKLIGSAGGAAARAGGLAAAAWSEPHALLYVAGLPRGKEPSSAVHAGLSAWRAVWDEPGLVLSAVSDALEDDSYKFYLPFLGDKNLAIIVNMAISPNNNTLVCLHCTGEVSAWRLPLLKLIHRWPLASQPQHDLANPLVDQVLDKKDKTIFYPTDVNWWDEEAIILARFSGAVSICLLQDLRNILGSKPEFLRGAPRLSAAHGGAFVALECETSVVPVKKREDSTEVVEQEYTEDTVYDLTKEMMKSFLYAITDMETFQPKPRKVTVVSRVYRLLGIKSTTPDELFSRKIESGQYESALSLAAQFGLDSDRVRQQQWRRAPVCRASIQACLSKISKKIWTVHQCVDRLPESLSAAKELLQFGLDLTNEEILKEINKDREVPITDPERIKLEDLNSYSSELLRCRHVMIFNRERLKLYERCIKFKAILRCEKSTYIKDEYDRLRSNSLIHSATELAKEGRLSALTCLWPHITNIELQMAVLEKVPETIDPYEYKDLLPTLLKEKKLKPVKLEQEVDWCKKDDFRSIWSSNWSEGLTPETEEPNVSATEISKWYKKRARQIDELSGIVSHAVSLLSIAAQDRGVDQLDELMFHVKTLDTLVYDLNVEDVGLKEVQEWSTLETCHMLMTGSTQASFVSDLKQYVVPYLKRVAKSSKSTVGSQLVEYLKSLSGEDLTYALLTLRSAKELEINVKTHLELASECLLARAGPEQLGLARDILTTIPDESDGTLPERELQESMTSLSSLVRACAVCARRGAAGALCELRRAAADERLAEQMVTGVARSLAVRDDKPTQQDWEKLLKDILELQATIFTCLSLEKCHEIYALSLLTSGDAPSIRLAGDVMKLSSGGNGGGRLVPYERSVALVTAAAREYFNSASELDDPALELARCCMTLIKDDNPQIQEELDLISALGLLSSFNLTILPIQVRLCEDKMTLIEECLKLDPNAYMASHKLLQLAKLLRIYPDDEQKREGAVLERVCAHALSLGAAGGAGAAAAARRLRALRHPAPRLLSHVADTAQAHADRSTRRDLYAAAATFCKGEDIEGILQSRVSLELEGLRRAPARRSSTDDEFADAVTTPVIEKKDLVPPLGAEKKTPLLNYLLDSWMNKFNSDDEVASARERVPHCPEFYRALYPALRPSPLHYAYCGFAAAGAGAADADAVDGAAALYAYYNDPERDRENEPEVISQCAEDLVYLDTPLAVSLLTGAGSTTKVAGGARAAGAARAACQLYAALLATNYSSLGDQAYLARPVQMARATLSNKSNATEDQLELVRACLAKLEARAEVRRLATLGFNVDGTFFENDEDYRRETLFRMARSEEPTHLQTAYRLARKYGVDELGVWAARARHAVAGPPLRSVPADLVPPPGYSPRDAAERMQTEIWPEIEGNDYAALINYFTLLKQIDEKTVQYGLTAADHVKLLKKAKAASQELDYKLLLQQPPQEVFLEHLLQIIRPENVGLLARLLRSLPPALRPPVAANVMYTAWLTHYLFTIPQSSASNKKWMQQFRQCAAYFTKLGRGDVQQLLENTCFSQQAVTRIPAGTRNLMLLQAIDYCQQERELERAASAFETSWAQVAQELTRWARFLDNFHSTTIRALIDAHSVPDDDIWPEIEKSHGDLEKMRVPLTRLVLERDVRRAALLTLLQCLHLDYTVEKIYEDILDKVDTEYTMRVLVMRVPQAHKNGVQFTEEYIERLIKMATDFGLSPYHQMGILELSRRAAPAGGDPAQLARCSAALVAAMWPDCKELHYWTEESIKEETRRWQSFQKLLAEVSSWEQKRALLDLLRLWPPTRSPHEPKSLQYVLVDYLLDSEDQKEALTLIKLLFNRGPVLTEEEIKLLSSKVTGASALTFLWVALLSGSEPARRALPALLSEHKKHIQNTKIEDELIKQCLDANLFTTLVSTPLYTPILHYILTAPSGEAYNVQWAVSKLKEKNLLAEAGHLQMLSMGVPAPLRGFTQSLLILKQSMFNNK